MTSLSSTNRENFQKIERSDRLLHPEDRKKSLWPDCSLIEIKIKALRVLMETMSCDFSSCRLSRVLFLKMIF